MARAMAQLQAGAVLGIAVLALSWPQQASGLENKTGQCKIQPWGSFVGKRNATIWHQDTMYALSGLVYFAECAFQASFKTPFTPSFGMNGKAPGP